MKIRDSGMPDAGTWERFFDPPDVLRQLGFPAGSCEVVDFGCGYGTFSIAAGALTRGTVHALDIDPEMVAVTSERARARSLSNVRALERDFVARGTGLAEASVGYAMLFNVLHAEDAVGLLREAYRVLQPGGVAAMIHWIHDACTPRGPALAIRPRPEQCLEWTRNAHLVPSDEVIALPPFHYGLVARKRRPITTSA